MNAILDYALLQYRNPYKYFFMLMMILWSAKTTELLKIAPDNMVMTCVSVSYTHLTLPTNSLV